MSPAPIVLLTDFGNADGYPGVMKGVIYSFCPEVPIIDLSHEVAAHNLTAAAFLLEKHHRYFPSGSIFVVVVDPGVGSERKILYLQWKDWHFIAPDNGVLTPFLEKPKEITLIKNVTQSDLFIVRRGNTFDGRDRFAPVAAHLARGYSPQELGPDIDCPVVIEGLLQPAKRVGRSILGQVVYVDSFGNLITTIEEADIKRLAATEKIFVKSAGQRIPVVNNYGAVRSGEAMAIVGGFGTLEIAVNQGSAHRALRIPVGQTIEVVTEY